jgi:asparagine N-glycosylation enzyme membrane subunit Stt3
MIVIPLVTLLILALIAVAWSPIFALILFAIAFVGFLLWTGMSRRGEQAPPPANSGAKPARKSPQGRIPG